MANNRIWLVCKVCSPNLEIENYRMPPGQRDEEKMKNALLIAKFFPSTGWSVPYGMPNFNTFFNYHSWPSPRHPHMLPNEACFALVYEVDYEGKEVTP